MDIPEVSFCLDLTVLSDADFLQRVSNALRTVIQNDGHIIAGIDRDMDTAGLVLRTSSECSDEGVCERIEADEDLSPLDAPVICEWPYRSLDDMLRT